ncbi:glutamate receptor ionotropic, kainate 2-like [Penaeus chinensis]|uniref:glutamate receptor ionotropic, kainate 2-like n=1 Tax=Penaeus chinensis TaxID=139456 RepID=UPI001FB75E5A|nr:glutamate receptor ionotropic, kainate 2-like [Penaeus chinensis]
MTGVEAGQDCLRVLALRWPPYTWWEAGQSADELDGLMRKVMDILATHIGFCCEHGVGSPGLRLSGKLSLEKESWGKIHPNGSVTGALGMMQNGELDMTLVPIGMSLIRSKVMDFSEYIHMDQQTVLYKRPSFEADMAGFIKPYSPVVRKGHLLDKLWLLLFLSSLVMCAAWATVHLGYERLLRPPGARLQRASERLYKSVLWTYSSAIFQAVPWEPQELALRTLSGLWLIAVLIIGTVYRSNLKAMLILPKVSLPFTNIEEFLETDIPVHIIEGSLSDEFTRGAAPNSSLGRLRERARVDGIVVKAIAEVFDGTLAGLSSFTGQLKLIDDSFSKVVKGGSTGQCRVYMSTDGVLSGTAVAMGFRKGFYLKPKIDHMIRGLREFGIIQHLFYNEMMNVSKCRTPTHSPGTSSLRPLELQDFYGVFSLYVGGIALAVIAFLFENVCKKQHRTAGAI